MSFFQSLKRALGFGTEQDDYLEDDALDATVIPLRERMLASAESESEKPDNEPAEESSDEEQFLSSVSPDIIFTEVLDVFNNNLPPFIKDSVNPEEQRKLLYEMMSESVKNYLHRIEEETEKKITLRLKRERVRLTKEIDSLKEKIEKAENSEQDSKRSQLSAERQKRAMNDRVHDLESQIAGLQAEREQFELENKSLINKLRAASIYEEDNNTLREQISTLSEQVKKGTAPALSQDEIDGIEALREKAEMADKLQAENKALLEEIELAKAKIEMGTQMMNSQNTIAATARQDLAAKTEEAESLSRQLTESIENLESANAEILQLKSELEEAHLKIDKINEIEEQIIRFEDIKIRKESKINELQAEKAELAEELRIKDNEVKSLKKTIERNILEQARSERELKDTIESLKQKLPAAAEPSEEDNLMPAYQDSQIKKAEPKPYQSGRRRKKQIKISAIDDSLDNTDWLVSSPPEGSLEQKSTNDDSFGYVPQVRKHIPDNDAQMLLFD